MTVLKSLKRAEKTLTDTEKFIREILEKYTPDVLELPKHGGYLILDIKDRIADFVKKSSVLSKSYQKQIVMDKPFSTALIADIETIYPLSEKFEQLITDVERKRIIDIDGNHSVTGVNAKLREDLQMQFLSNLVETAANITGDKQKTIRAELIQIFLETLGMSPDSAYKAELEESANKLFNEFFFLKQGFRVCLQCIG